MPCLNFRLPIVCVARALGLMPLTKWFLAMKAVFLRRKRLIAAQGVGFLVSLIETVSVNQGNAFELDDGCVIKVIVAEEPALVGDLARLA